VTVGAGVAAGDVEHSTPMLSLDNVFDADELRAWAARLERVLGRPALGYTVEPKIDGMAIAARYVDGRLRQVATRGDGRAGEDVTTQARLVAGLPAERRRPVTVEIRGEVFMTDADFARANELRTAHGGQAFANPRSAAAGTLRAQDRAYDAPLCWSRTRWSAGPARPPAACRCCAASWPTPPARRARPPRRGSVTRRCPRRCRAKCSPRWRR
jgi:DNA ligase (NAD+)